jgi:PAS domain S-box-containing protein
VKTTIGQILTRKKRQILSEWTHRLGAVWTQASLSDRQKLVHYFYDICLEFFIDHSVRDTHEALQGAFDLGLTVPVSEQTLQDAFLLSRYVLLTTLADDDPEIDGIQTFTQINGAFMDLWKRLFPSDETRTGEMSIWLPEAFESLTTSGLLTVDFAGIGLFVLDRDLNIIHWSRGMERMYGLSREAVLGRHLLVKFPMFLEEASVLSAIHKSVLSGEESELMEHQHRTLYKGSRTINFKIAPLRNSEGRIYGSSILVHDITDQIKLRDQLIQSEKLAAVGELAAGIAHEIGAPLTAISSISQLLMENLKDDFSRDKMSIIQQSIDRIHRTVRTLVDFSKPGRRDIEPIHLNSVIEQVIGILKYDTRLKHQTVETHLQPDLGTIMGNLDQMLQVFINICLNAAEAMKEKTDGRLVIHTWSDPSRIYASVMDNGTGVDSKDLPHIFEPFYTTKEEGKGTGLGLWVSYNIIQSVAGTINVESRVGEGTTFTVSLPLPQSDTERSVREPQNSSGS